MTKQFWVLAGVVIVLVIGGVVFFAKYSGSPAAPTAPPEQITPPTAVTPTPAPATPSQPAANPAPTPAPRPGNSSLYITAPAAGAQWIINQPQIVSWNKEAGFTGSIYLVNSAGVTEGWINSNTAVHQTSYTWDGRQLFAARNSPTKKDIAPGKYVVHVKFDNKNLPELKSSTVTIIYPEQAVYQTYSITIKGFAFVPATLSLQAGDKVIFVNNDTVAHEVVSSKNFGPYLLQPGESATLDTKPLISGTYNYVCDIHPGMTGSITVK